MSWVVLSCPNCGGFTYAAAETKMEDSDWEQVTKYIRDGETLTRDPVEAVRKLKFCTCRDK